MIVAIKLGYCRGLGNIRLQISIREAGIVANVLPYFGARNNQFIDQALTAQEMR